MVLYILNGIKKSGRYPDNLIDENMKTDYTRLRRLAAMFAEEDEMKTIIENEKTEQVEIKDKFMQLRKVLVKENNGESPIKGHNAIKWHQRLGFSKLFTTTQAATDEEDSK
jgi:predicted transcriptional regulator